ncbi:MAG TPA: NADP-dependent oxidoreductase [Steroidobacteraceae bacterium]|nr:NADP-dependent oxidoreductase [Steroidobacteraceae bacterium]
MIAASLCIAASALAAPATMQAIVQTGADAASFQMQTVDTPRPAADQALIKVYAAAVNPVDWKRVPAPISLPSGSALPAIPGYDAAGVIDSVGGGVTAFKPGDAVVARVTGAFAQYVVVDVAQVVPKPKRFTYEQASGIPIAGMAGYGAAEAANIRPGQRIAIIGAAGGAGSAAVDVVHAKGGKVIASGHSSQAAWLKQQGVEEFVAYDKDNVAERIRNVDAVLNMVESQAATALAYVKRGGMFTSISGMPSAEQCAAAGVTCVQIRATAPGMSIGDTLRALVALADAGRYRVRVTKVFPLARAAEAQQFAHTGDSVGKVILSVDPRSGER